MKPIEITPENYNAEVVDSPVPVFADFYATWCGPCKSLAPIVESITEKYADKVKFVKIDTDNNLELAQKFGISSIPALMILENGQQAEFLGVGLVPQAEIEKKLDAYLQQAAIR